MRTLSRTTVSLSFCAALAACAVGCANDDVDAATDDDGAASDEAALTAGQLDASFHASLEETFLGTSGTKLLFFGTDAAGTYVARRSVRLVLDASYGAAGKAYVNAPVPLPTNNVQRPRAWISAATALPDGRVVITGGREGRGDYVRYGAYVRESKLTLGIVAADGHSSTLDAIDALPTYPTIGGCSLLAQSGGLVRLLADGSLAVSASTTCLPISRAAARLYHFTPSATGFVFDRLFWQGADQGTYTNGRPVTSLVEGAPGKLLVGDSGGSILPAGNVRASLPQHGYEATTLTNPAPTAARTSWVPTVGASSQYTRASVAARASDGTFVVAGYVEASRCIGLQHTSQSPELELVFGAPPLPATCVPASKSEDPVALLPAPSGRFLLVTDAASVTFPAPGSAAPVVVTLVTRVRSVDAAGNVDTSFGAAGMIDLPNARHPNGVPSATPQGAFVARGYLYLQLWDDLGVTSNGGGKVRRIKL